MYVEQVSFIQYAMIDILPFFTLNKQQQWQQQTNMGDVQWVFLVVIQKQGW
jgi:hypothetical protein